MRILFQMYHAGELHDLGIIEDGDVVESIEDGFEDWVRLELSHHTTPDLDDAEGILEAYEGPNLIAKIVDE
ncbi:hypothetical protein GJR96_07850 [Haloferax sp. MBLA0076]|uniref:Uncharacterized protein n=1 Tax=Haloferax litoreum TaxID=2666140 RepID=A0A6A8GFD3_9EURY|nr:MULTISPECIES: hypothetical protein [Haloferax]KAB1193360.1 hypothetical protein Hfx1148_07845 [Haloferax sp. CBA1148]MRX21868.1 hypothetical protein [Haloferax litoreum]